MTHPIPDGDVLIHAGDFTNVGELDQVEDFIKWLTELPHKHKIFIAGNHDISVEDDPTIVNYHINNITYLQDSMTEVAGLRIYGSPWTPTFGSGWAFNADRGKVIAEKWAMIPDDVDVLVTHGPMAGILDQTQEGDRVGCEDLFQRRLPNLKLHVCGHIHEAYGRVDTARASYVNACICNRRYQPINPPIVVDL